MSAHSIGHGSGTRGATQASVQTTKLPSFIPVPYASQIADLALVYVPSPVLRVMGEFPVLWGDLPLQATVDKLIDCIPTAWKKVWYMHN